MNKAAVIRAMRRATRGVGYDPYNSFDAIATEFNRRARKDGWGIAARAGYAARDTR